MPLSDRDLRAIIAQLNFETDDQTRPFNLDAQLQPSSIDLRIDRVFWRPQRRLGHALDLRKFQSGAIDIRRLFSTRRLLPDEGITIAPGKMILGRTFEKFTIPNGYAGKLEGRSSYARLGLSLHCTGDFINPGWRGQMPLQIVNHGVTPIILAPYIEICQLIVMRVSSLSERPYGETPTSKYVNDDGGPSRYWLDKGFAKLQSSIGQTALPDKMQNEFLQAFGHADIDLMDRFSDFVRSLRPDEITSAREIMDRFADIDTKRKKRSKQLFISCRTFLFLPVGTALGALLKPPYTKGTYIFEAISILFFLVGAWAWLFATEPPQPFTRRDVEKYFSENRPST